MIRRVNHQFSRHHRGRWNVAGEGLFADDDDSQPNDSTRGAWGRPCVRCSGGIKDCDGKMGEKR